MRIAVVSRGWWPFVKGGAERFIDRVSIELGRRGHEIYVVTRKGFGPFKDDRHVIYVESLRLPMISSFVFSLRAGRVVSRLGVDVALVNGYWGETSPLYIDDKIPVLLILHDVGLFSSPVARRDFVRYALRVWGLRRVCRRVSAIAVPSRVVAGDVIRYLGVEPSKIYVLGAEGVDAPMARIHIENGYIDVLHLARFAPNKAQHISLEAIEILAGQVPNIRLWLVGGSGISRREINYMFEVIEHARRINSRFGREVVKVVVNARDTSIYYKIADICIAPSIAEEGYGLSVAECMGHGKPVIVSDIFKETGVASEERAYIVKRGDPKALSEMIKHAIENKEESLEKALKGLEYARKNCSWEKVTEKIEITLKKIVTKNTI